MRLFGFKTQFALEYEKYDDEESYFEMWVKGVPVCCFILRGERWTYRWDLSFVVAWLNENLEYIIQEDSFPFDIPGDTSIELLKESGKFESDDEDEFFEWFSQWQDWYFRHSWYSNRGGSFLAEVLFRRVGDQIEIEWDNTSTYEDVTFVNPKGLYYIDLDVFKQVVEQFLADQKGGK